MSTTIQKWGNSLGVRVPKEFADQMDLHEGSEVEFHQEDGRLIVEPVRNRYDLDELVNEITDENRHEEQTAGRAGREAW